MMKHLFCILLFVFGVMACGSHENEPVDNLDSVEQNSGPDETEEDADWSENDNDQTDDSEKEPEDENQTDNSEDSLGEIIEPDGYQLVWHDEFDIDGYISSDWTAEIKNSGWVNNELQNYVGYRRNKPATIEIYDGLLHINCYKDTDGKIYSGRIYAKVKEGWTYGYFEASINLPSGYGTWPAFWMMPVNFTGWPDSGEMDIMEEVGVVPNEVSSSLHALGHYHVNNTQVTKARLLEGAEGSFHKYALEWTPEYIITYVDDEPLLHYENDGSGDINWPYHNPFYLILNLAWGGDWGGMWGVHDGDLPVTMLVDYVRVFQKNEN